MGNTPSSKRFSPLEELPADGDPRYYRTPDGVHHVPKRRLEDVLIGKSV